MAFTYIDLLPEMAPLNLYTSAPIATEVAVDTVHQPLFIYTATYDEEGAATDKWPFHKRTDGYIAGTTIDETAAVMGSVLLTCLWNKNMMVVATTISDPTTGAWIIYGLDPDDTYGYTIIAQDPITGAVYNSVSYDKITPVAL